MAHFILTLPYKSGDQIIDVTRVVLNDEAEWFFEVFLEGDSLIKLLVHFLHKSSIIGARQLDLIIYHLENSIRHFFNQFQDRRIVNELNHTDVGETLVCIQLLLHFERVLYEVLLQLLVGVIYAKLLE